MVIRSCLLACFLFCVLSGSAQDVLLKGVVRDSLTGETLVGVNVTFVQGKGTATDVNGAYSLRVPVGPVTITYSFVGYDKLVVPLDLPMAASVTRDVVLQVSSNQLDMVVVSAGKFEQRMGEVTQSISVLPPAIVQNKNINALDNALDQVPGVVVIDNDPQIRAGSGFSFGAGSRVMMLVDDLPILSGDIGRPSWTFLPIENLEQIEVIKGASSVLYGSAALTGVINVRTAYPRSEPHTRATVFAGTYGTPRNKNAKWWGENNPLQGGASFFHAEKFGNFDLVLGGNAFSDAGYVGPEPIPADSVAADPLTLAPAGYENRVRFNIATRWRNRKVDGLNYGINGNVMRSRSTNVFIWNDIDSGIYRSSPGTLTRTLGTQCYIDPFLNYYAPSGLRHSVKTRYYYQDFDNDNEQSNASHFLYGEYQLQQTFELWGPTTLTGGVVGQRTQSTAVLYAGNTDGSGENVATNAALYMQADKKLAHERLMVSAGLRYESFTVNDDAQSTPVFRAGATYHLFEGTFLRGSYGQGFRFPTIGERFITTSVGQLNIFPSPELQPEQSWNLEFGVKQGFRFGGFQGYLDVVAFQQEYDQYIEFTFGQWLPEPEFASLGFRSLNTGGARVRGLETELVGKAKAVGVDLTFLMGYTWTNPVSTTPDLVYADPVGLGKPSSYASTSYDTTGDILKYRVERLFRADVQGERGRISAGVSVRYNSHVRNLDKVFVDLDESGLLSTGVGRWMETHTTGDWLVDLRVGLRLGEHQRIAFIVNNVTNKEYAVRPLAIEPMRNFQVQFTYSI